MLFDDRLTHTYTNSQGLYTVTYTL